jgi:2-dehydro-3-deoxyphosphogluconate aldolase/(4S)-4-hydroxy-2-oxoglutarate aldolase
MPGALTPTEIVSAWQAGADVVKVFPCSALGGAKYLKALQGPLPQIQLIPTGGVSLATAEEFLAAGAFALGVGGDLVDAKAAREGRTSVITENAQKYIGIVKKFRSAN